jgi:hypothetical protein
MKATRNNALDFVKGLLVLGMFIYHANVLFGANSQFTSFINGTILDFISGSYVFISGLIVSLYYREKFQNDKVATTRRLWVRGGKIIGVFVALNLIILILNIFPSDRTYTWSTLIDVFGVGGRYRASFSILLGIGYVLMISPVILSMGIPGILVALAAIAISGITVAMGHSLTANLWMIMCGVGGVAVGGLVAWSGMMRKDYSMWARVTVLAGTLMCVVVYYYMRIEHSYGKGDILMYLFGVISILSFLYAGYYWLLRLSTFEVFVRWLGTYSLVAYIGQVAIIWIWYAVTYSAHLKLPYWFNFSIALVLMLIMIKMIDYLRTRHERINSMYISLFG